MNESLRALHGDRRNFGMYGSTTKSIGAKRRKEHRLARLFAQVWPGFSDLGQPAPNRRVLVA